MFIDFRGRGRETERNINQLPPVAPQLGTEPTTNICALTWNRTHNPLVYRTMFQPTHPTRASKSIYDKGAKNTQWGKNSFFNVVGNLENHMQKNEFGSLSYTIQQILTQNGLKTKHKTRNYKTPKRKHKNKAPRHWQEKLLDNDLLDTITKAQATKAKINK